MDRLETIINLCTTHLKAGNNYTQINDYKSAIQEFTKVIELLPKYIDLAIELNKSNPPPEVKESIFINIRANAQTAYMGRAMSYLAIGEESKAKADRDMADKIKNKTGLEEIKSELTGGGAAGCITIVVIIFIIYMFLS